MEEPSLVQTHAVTDSFRLDFYMINIYYLVLDVKLCEKWNWRLDIRDDLITTSLKRSFYGIPTRLCPQPGDRASRLCNRLEGRCKPRDIAQAQIVSSTTKVYNGALLEAVLLVVNAVVLPLGTNALYDLIKGIVVKQHKHIKLTQLDQPDGTHLLVIEEEE